MAIELDDDPEKDRGDDTLIALPDGESPGGILGLGRCQSIEIIEIMSKYSTQNITFFPYLYL